MSSKAVKNQCETNRKTPTVCVNTLGKRCVVSGEWEFSIYGGCRVRLGMDPSNRYCQWGAGCDMEYGLDSETMAYRLVLAWAAFDTDAGDTAVWVNGHGEKYQVVRA